MDGLITEGLMNILLISLTFSCIEMALIQKVKSISLFKKNWHVILFNFISSFILGTLFSISFFELSIYDGLWVALFGFIGAPSIYEVLKKQNIVNYTPKTIGDVISVKRDNEIKRD